jgi:hypothetical protein
MRIGRVNDSKVTAPRGKGNRRAAGVEGNFREKAVKG